MITMQIHRANRHYFNMKMEREMKVDCQQGGSTSSHTEATVLPLVHHCCPLRYPVYLQGSSMALLAGWLEEIFGMLQ